MQTNNTRCVLKEILIEVLGLKFLQTCLFQHPPHMLDSINTNQPHILWWRRFIKGRFSILEEGSATYPYACLFPITHMRTVIAKWVKQLFKRGTYLLLVKLSNSWSTSFTNIPVATQSAPKFPETNIKENYIVVNFMVMIKSESNTVKLRSRLNSYMSLYFLLQNNEGRALFLTLRSNAVWTCSYSVTHHLSSQADSLHPVPQGPDVHLWDCRKGRQYSVCPICIHLKCVPTL